MEITLLNGGYENSIQRLQVYVNYLKPQILFFVIYPDVAQEVPDFLLSSVPLKKRYFLELKRILTQTFRRRVIIWNQSHGSCDDICFRKRYTPDQISETWKKVIEQSPRVKSLSWVSCHAKQPFNTLFFLFAKMQRSSANRVITKPTFAFWKDNHNTISRQSNFSLRAKAFQNFAMPSRKGIFHAAN